MLAASMSDDAGSNPTHSSVSRTSYTYIEGETQTIACEGKNILNQPNLFCWSSSLVRLVSWLISEGLWALFSYIFTQLNQLNTCLARLGPASNSKPAFFQQVM